MTAVRLPIAALLLAMNASLVQSETRIDYDLDDDGLIEINDLQDLNEIRNNFNEMNELSGETLYQSSDGCPAEGCNGYELSGDLNFDTNNNNTLDEGDTFWNEGLGWLPIGYGPYKFTSEFNGNGYTLHNLVIRRPGDSFVGLFSYGELAHFYDFNLSVDVVASDNSGGVVGHSWNSEFSNLNLNVVINFDNGDIDCAVNICAPEHLGGVVGSSDESRFENIVVNADITGVQVPGVYGVLGGLAGSIAQGTVKEVAVRGCVAGSERIGGLVGYATGTDIQSVVAMTVLDGSGSVGGIIGNVINSRINNALVSGLLTTGTGTPRWGTGGGLYGLVGSDVEVQGAVSLVRLPEDAENAHYIGALSGMGSISTVNDVYWASDLALRDYSKGDSHSTGLQQTFTLADIQCATDTSNCNGLQFTSFANQTNSQDQALWEFGSEDAETEKLMNEQAPQMVMAAGTFGDKNGDGKADDWPYVPVPEGQDPIAERPSCEDAATEDGSSSSGFGGLFYLIFLVMPLIIRRR